MTFWLFLIIILLLCNSGDREAKNLGQQMLFGVLAAFALSVAGVFVALGFEFYPTLTLWLLIALAATGVAFLVRKIYRRFFSAQARLNAAYARMHKSYYALSWHVQVELGRSAPSDLTSVVEKGERILQRCREEHARYSKLPPETGSDAYKTQLYIEDIQRLEDKLRSFSAPK